MKLLVFLLPVIVGVGVLVVSLWLFRQGTLYAKQFGIGMIAGGMLMVSPLIYLVLDAVKSLFDFVYTFVFGFGLAILLLIVLVIYLILALGQLREENKTLWQEVALLRTEVQEAERSSESD